MKHECNFSFVNNDNVDFSAVRIDSGDYAGVIFAYNRVAVSPEENKDGTRDLIFDYNILQNPNNADVNCQEFVNLIGDFLVTYMEDCCKRGDFAGIEFNSET